MHRSTCVCGRRIIANVPGVICPSCRAAANLVTPPPPNAWHTLHGRVAEGCREPSTWSPEEFRRWYYSAWLPSICMECRPGWAYLSEVEDPIDWSASPLELFAQFHRLHNAVSVHHAKRPTITLAEAQGLFRVPVARRPRALITCGAGDHYDRLLAITRPHLARYAARCGADFVELGGDLRPAWPMANKYRMTRLAWHYDHALLIDADCLPTPGAPDIFDAAGSASIAARDERPDYRPADWFAVEAADFYASQLVEFYPDRCINAGVMVFRPEALEYYTEPPRPYPKYWCGEQFWIWYRTRNAFIEWLDDRYNWAAIRSDFRDHLGDAWIIHLNGIHDPKIREQTAAEIVREWRIL